MKFKKIIIILIPSALILFLIACAAKKELDTTGSEEFAEKKVTGKQYLWAFKPSINVRESNSAQSPNFAILSDGDSVMVLANENGWYKVKTESGRIGWIRTDLLGPKRLSAFIYAVTFADSLKQNRDIELYFDKNLYHRRIYLSFPAEYYSSKNHIEQSTQEIVEKYQDRVYGGEVTVRVLKPGSEDEYLTATFDGQKNADPILPIIPFGQIVSVRNPNPESIALSYAVSNEISDADLLSAARNICATFPISYQHVTVTFFDNAIATNHECLLWYQEDKNGEEYKFFPCQ